MSQLSQFRMRLYLSGVPQNLPLIPASIRGPSTSRYKGVTRTRRGTWQAQIYAKGTNRCLGTFAVEEEAALAYARAKWYFQHIHNNHEESTGLPNQDETVPIQEDDNNIGTHDGSESSGLSNGQGAPLQADSVRLARPSEPQLDDDEDSTELSNNDDIVPIQENGNNNNSGGLDLINDQYSSPQVLNDSAVRDRPPEPQQEAAGISNTRNLSPFDELRHIKEKGYDIRKILDFLGVPKTLSLLPSMPGSRGPYKGSSKTSNMAVHAYVCERGNKLHLGTFATAEEAALVHARAAWYLEHRTPRQGQTAEGLICAQGTPTQVQDDSALPLACHPEPQLDGNEEAAGSSNPHDDVYGGFDLSNVPNDLPLVLSRKPGSKNRYRGVSQISSQKWQATVKQNGTTRYLGLFRTAQEAALVHARAAWYLEQQAPHENAATGWRSNQPGATTSDPSYSKIQASAATDIYGGLDLSSVPRNLPLIMSSKPGASNRYMGVHRNSEGRVSWRAVIKPPGKKKVVYLGSFSSAEEAARIYARASYLLEQRQQQQRKGRNAALKSTTNGHRKTDKASLPAAGQNPAHDVDGDLDLSNVPQNLPLIPSARLGGESKWKGVRRSGNNFAARINANHKLLHLGTFPTEEEAARAYARADYYFRTQQTVDSESNDDRKPRAKKRPPADDGAGLATTKRPRTRSSSKNDDEYSCHGVDTDASQPVNESQLSTENHFLDDYDAKDLAIVLEKKGSVFLPLAARVRQAGIEGAYLVDLLSAGKQSFDQFLDAIGAVDMLMRFSIWRAFDVIPRRTSSTGAASSAALQQAANGSQNGSTSNVSYGNDGMSSLQSAGDESNSNRPASPRAGLSKPRQISLPNIEEFDDEDEEGYQCFFI